MFLAVPHDHEKRGLGGGCTRFNAALDPHNDMLEVESVLPKDHPPVPLSHYPPSPPITPPASPTRRVTQLSEPPKSAIDTSFNARMRSYMTQLHQDFLTELSRHSIRAFVESHRAEQPFEGSTVVACLDRRIELSELCAAYDDCVMALKRWRDGHIVIVTQYVIVPARAVGGANEPGRRVSVNTTTGETVERQAKPVRGTGGTSLIPLLKIYRNNTLGRLLSPRFSR